MYSWPGMKKLSWEVVIELAEKGELIGCYKLYGDNSESLIDEYTIEDLMDHHNNGGEFGVEKQEELITELCGYCECEVKIKSYSASVCPECQHLILPCSMCNNDEVNCDSDCPYKEDELYKIPQTPEKDDKIGVYQTLERRE